MPTNLVLRFVALCCVNYAKTRRLHAAAIQPRRALALEVQVEHGPRQIVLAAQKLLGYIDMCGQRHPAAGINQLPAITSERREIHRFMMHSIEDCGKNRGQNEEPLGGPHSDLVVARALPCHVEIPCVGIVREHRICQNTAFVTTLAAWPAAPRPRAGPGPRAGRHRQQDDESDHYSQSGAGAQRARESGVAGTVSSTAEPVPASTRGCSADGPREPRARHGGRRHAPPRRLQLSVLRVRRNS